MHSKPSLATRIIVSVAAAGSIATGIAVPVPTAMSAVSLIPIMFLGVVLVLGLAAILRARPEDIPSIVRALSRWLRR
jgi:hypothetical protein